jgi:hypothetical protein
VDVETSLVFRFDQAEKKYFKNLLQVSGYLEDFEGSLYFGAKPIILVGNNTVFLIFVFNS